MAHSIRIPLLVALVLLFVLTGAVIGVKAMTKGSSPAKTSLVSHDCPFPVGAGPFRKGDVRCGFLEVPENRQAATGRTITLAVAVFKARAANASADPFIYLSGGPGGAIVQSMGASVAANGMPGYVGNRDLILVDQRGAGLSRPSLACPEYDAVGRGATTKPLSERALITKGHTAIQQCRARLVKQGIDLSAYNTVENAADIAELWKALGYSKANVYGGSHGARLALQVLRDRPDGIRSVVVDAVADPSFNEYNDAIPNAWRSIQLVFSECAAAPGCRSTYPHLAQTFNDVIARLQAHPITGQEYVAKWGRSYPVTIDGARFAATVMGALYSPEGILQTPAMIWSTAHGDYRLLFQAAGAASAASVGSSEGMYLSMECADDQAGTSSSTIAASAARLPRSIRSGVIAARTDALTLCRLWNVQSVPARNRQLFTSTIPTLLLEGSFDPRTPPARAQAVARTLSHSSYFEFPSLGHGVVGKNLCSDSIVRSFLTDPSRKPDVACMANLPRAYQ